MGARIEPTKANLIRLRNEAAFAAEGLSILDRKREILLREFTALAATFIPRRERLREKLAGLCRKTADELASLGPRYAAYETLPLPGTLTIRKTEKRVMGVKLSVLTMEPFIPAPRPLAPGLDDIIRELAGLMPELLSYVESVSAMRRLNREIAKTQKREKAIEEIHLPSYRRAIAEITAALDENGREELVRSKSLKRRLTRKSSL
jgi:V/A-type H+-transporting ATPase subunit D